jgi:hypothetical protein
MSRVFVGILLLSAVASGQASPTFEVASIRPSSEQVAPVSAGMRIAGSQVRLTGMSLKEYIVIAYGVKPQQIVGPDWLGQTRFVDRPVLDQTGLTGEYDVVLNIAPEDYMPLMVRSGVNAGVALPPQALRLLDGANTDPLSGPLRDVGLTLESRKAPLEVVVVDAISKTPTEN